MSKESDSNKEKRSVSSPLIEGIDYYIEDGKWVFTSHFLRNRGYCCKSGCRHCPYGYQKPVNPHK